MAKETSREFLIRVKADINDANSQLKKITEQLKKTGKSAGGAKPKIDGIGKSLGRLKQAAIAYFTVRTAVQLIKQADAYNVLQQRIKTATKNTGDYVKVSRELFNISRQNGTELKTSVSLFQNLARSSPELKATNTEMLELTNAVQQLGVISGASQANLSAGLLQFSQGLSSGIFRAEEFNSLLENIPEVAVRIANGMELTTGELRKQIIEGKVLSKDVFDSLLKQSNEINEEFKGIPVSIGRAGSSLVLSGQKFLNYLEQSYDVAQNIADVMQATGGFISDYVDINSGAGLPLKTLKNTLSDLEKELENLKNGDVSFWDKLWGGGEDFIKNRIVSIRKTIGEIEKIKLLQDGVNGEKPQNGLEKIPIENKKLIGKDDSAQVDAYNQSLLDYNNRLKKLMDDLNPAAVATRDYMQKIQDLDKAFFEGRISAEEYDKSIEKVAEGDGFDKLANKGEDAFKRLEAATRGWGNEFTNTFADMVKTGKLEFSRLADSIITDLLRIAIQKTITAPLFAGLGIPGFSAPTKHTGGMIGAAGGASKVVNPAVFLNAPRYHTGGFPGLKKDEVPIIGLKGEEVLSRDDPRNAINGGVTSSPSKIEIINNGAPQQVQSANTQFDGKQMVTKIILDDLNRGGNISRAIKGR